MAGITSKYFSGNGRKSKHLALMSIKSLSTSYPPKRKKDHIKIEYDFDKNRVSHCTPAVGSDNIASNAPDQINAVKSIDDVKSKVFSNKPLSFKIKEEPLTPKKNTTKEELITPKKNIIKQELMTSNNNAIKEELINPKKNIIKEEPPYLKDEIEEVADGSWRPKNWHLLYNNIKEMRKDWNAVVDSQGCEMTPDFSSKPEVVRYQILISLMLSSQTKDIVTFEVMKKLKNHGLTIQNILKTSEKKLGELIKAVGFWKRKTKYIKAASLICHNDFNDDIPETLKGLMSLPGVGPKMAHICMHAAWGQTTGIGVDTHVHRISNWLNFVRKPTKTPEHTRKELESWLPISEWQHFNLLLVGFGQQTCLSFRPKCDICLNRSICPATKVRYVKTKTKTLKIKKEAD